MFIVIIIISLFICSSCTIPQTNYQDNQNSTIINHKIASKNANIIPSASETYTTNIVNWCIYEDGALVINGTNASTYNGHSGIKYSGTDLSLYSMYDFDYTFPPWYQYRLNIKTVEFAKITKPRTMQGWFSDCINLINIDSTNLDTSAVTEMDKMFRNCSSLTDLNLSDWDTSAVTNMSFMFDGCSGLSDLSGLSNWKFPAVINMSYMFSGCSSLTDLNLSDWDTSAVTDMEAMFLGCTELFRIDLSNWTMKSAKLYGMFDGCSKLQIIFCENTWEATGGISWKPNGGDIFRECTQLKSNSSHISFSSSSIDVDMANPTTGYFTKKSDSPYINWCLCNDGTLIINTDNSESYNEHNGIKCMNDNLNLIHEYNNKTDIPWNEHRNNITSVEFTRLTKPIATSYWFSDCSKLTSINTTNLDIPSVTNMSHMFSGCSGLTDLSPISNWDVSAVTDMSSMFSGCSGLTDLDVSEWDTSSVTSMAYMFNGCSSLTDLNLSDWDTSAVTNMNYMFYACSGLTDLDVSHWNVSKVWYMKFMFGRCSNIKVIHLDNWYPANGVCTYGMFVNCRQLEIIYCKNAWTCYDFYVDGRHRYIENMFFNCPLLHNDITGKKYDISSKSSTRGDKYADPKNGLFTIPVLGTYTPTIEKTIIDNNGNIITNFKFEDGQFAFLISSSSDAPLPESHEVYTDETGKAIWPEIKFYEPGEYIYEITEKPGNIPGISYDTAPHELKVTIRES